MLSNLINSNLTGLGNLVDTSYKTDYNKQLESSLQLGVTGASVGSSFGPLGALIGGSAGIGTGLLTSAVQDISSLYTAPDSAKKAVADYMNQYRDNSDPKVLPQIPIYMNKWVWIIGGVAIGAVIANIIYKKYKKRR